jgi:hypothetical protein
MTIEPHTSEKATPPALHCCQGEPAPDGVVQGWNALRAMRTSAQQAFVELLTTSIVEPDERVLEGMLAAFCDAHDVEPGTVLAALKASQFLLQRSAALDLDPELFTDDLQKLSSGDTAGLRLVASRYLPLKQRIREHLLEQSLADHGSVLVDLDWRVDHIASIGRAVNLNKPVVFLTLQLRDAEKSERITVQLTPRSIRLLRQFSQRFSESGGA